MARVLVTRAAEDSVGICHALVQLGHRPVRVPLIQRLWAVDALAQAATDHPKVDWVIITSGASADVLAAAAPGAWLDAKIGAVGPATARRLAAMGRMPDLVPRRHLGAALVRLMGDLRGQRVVYPKGDLAPPATGDALREAGAEVVEVVAYHNVTPAGARARLVDALPVEVTPLLSGSAARRLHEALEGSVDQLGEVIAIGPSTAAVAHEVGLPVHQVAEPHTLEGLLRLIR